MSTHGRAPTRTGTSFAHFSDIQEIIVKFFGCLVLYYIAFGVLFLLVLLLGIG